MSREFKIITRYYDDYRKLYKHNTVEFKPGITILVGCNGSGKTTLLRQIKNSLEKNEIPYVYHDNLKDGGSRGREIAFYNDDYELGAALFCSSEGEQIALNLGTLARNTGYMITHSKGNEKWILLDAIDSGLSIDQVQDVKKNLFHMILDMEKGKEIYIICSANEYEMCCDEPCFNIVDGKYVSINSYEDYKKEIIKTRKYKDKWENKRNNEEL